MLEFCFSENNIFAADGIKDSLKKIFGGKIPVIICVGTDATIGDSLGPICGTMLKDCSFSPFVYGSLSQTVTAKEIKAIKEFCEKAHPLAKTLVIDAAVGKKEDVGLIKISDKGIKPGLGANKNLPFLGDASIIGIAAERSAYNFSLLNLTRLGSIYRMAEVITSGIKEYLSELKQELKAASL